ncbi:hypothetical protein NBRC10512_002281 [Rhodotorula toruloides]|uniref:RHTO0S08e06634g1_1 n=2 Tax=Rhodotorula toruloides TaxID=5286 RepID=A0A061B2Y6_RHOTO|nr:uncharacterized protein RHTO_00967 [Rhodotorula toruloides NP11]EMS22213.1 hypothetical protein RHTO_00967 [Rhodotorula toruloides NP11]CDR43833.1 RHTO0S08e06634g1_1 [Rhodotorula toruloides]
MAVVWDRLREAEQRGQPVQTLVAGQLAYSLGRVLPESSTSLKRIVLVGGANASLSSCDFAKELYPALSSLALGVRLYAVPPPRPASPLALAELLLTSPDEDIIRDFCNPAVTPLLRHLCLLGLDFPSTSSPAVFSDVALFKRLAALEISYRQTPPTPAAAAFAPNFPVPTLLRTEIAYFGDLSLPSPPRTSASTAAWPTSSYIHRLAARVEWGLRPKVFFLPDNLHPDATPVRDFGLGEIRDRFLATLKKHGNPSICWYRADEEMGASPSEPFRRYLDRERLEGRM